MKKIFEFVTRAGELRLATTDEELIFDKLFRIEEGRWEVYVDESFPTRVITLKARFQEPQLHTEHSKTSSYFLGGKL